MIIILFLICLNKIMNEPIYQIQGLSRAEIITNLTICLRYKINDDVLLVNIIDEIVPKSQDFVSYSEYYTFLHTQYKNLILDRFNYLNAKPHAKSLM